MADEPARRAGTLLISAVLLGGCNLVGESFPSQAPIDPGTAEIGVTYRYDLYTHCGLLSRPIVFDGSEWVIEGPYGDYWSPEGFDNPEDHGTIVLDTEDTGTYRSSGGVERRITRAEPTRPRPSYLYGCWEAPDSHDVPPEVVPPTGPDAAVMSIRGSGSPPGWMEGGIFFIRAVSPSGTTVLEQRFNWPSDDVPVPPGQYQVTLFARSCDGNCDSLSAPTLSCTLDLLAEPTRTFVLAYELHVPASYTSYADLGATCGLVQ
jgi:hypothetical protein